MKPQKVHQDRIYCELTTLQVTSEELTTLTNESVKQNIIKLKCKQRAKAHPTEDTDNETVFNTLAAPSPNLQRK